MKTKLEALISRLEDLDSLVVAFSGGVDSSFLLAVARQALGERVLAVTAVSVIHPQREKEEAVRFASERGIEHLLLQGREMEIPEFLSNNSDRCYHCKKSILSRVNAVARERGIPHVADGSNMDDQMDFRPGSKAAKEARVLSPLMDAGMTKEEIRALSKGMGLPCWDKPSMACLASRIPYGEPITREKLKMVEEAEDRLFLAGLKQIRVRYHGTVARIEVDGSEFDRLMEPNLRRRIVQDLRKLGFLHVTLDMEGYVPGSLNRALVKEK